MNNNIIMRLDRLDDMILQVIESRPGITLYSLSKAVNERHSKINYRTLTLFRDGVINIKKDGKHRKFFLSDEYAEMIKNA